MSHLIRRTLRIAVVTALVLVCGVSASAQIGRVNGVIKDDENVAIKGATITASHDQSGNSLTASTDDKGRFTMIGLRAGIWAFVAMAPGHRTNGIRMAVRASGNNPPVLLSLDRNGPGIGGALERVAAKDLQSSLQAADTLFARQKWDEAIAAYRAIASMAPPLRFVQLQIAAASIAKNDLATALAAYRELVQADPADERAAIGIAQLQRQMGDAAAAENTLAQAVKAEGARPEVFHALGALVADLGRRDDSVEWFEKAHAADPYWGKPLYELGRLAAHRGDRAAATDYWERAIKVDPMSPEADLARKALAQLDEKDR